MAFFSIACSSASELKGTKTGPGGQPGTHKVLVVGGGNTLVVATVGESRQVVMGRL